MRIPEIITIGRIGVDLYANEAGASFIDPQTFTKSLGGSPTNVAIAAARLGSSSAIVTKVGSDVLGPYAIERLKYFKVDTQFVGITEGGRTPIVMTSQETPDDPYFYFIRDKDAPDTTHQVSDLPVEAISGCKALWFSLSTFSQGTTAQSAKSWLQTRARKEFTLIDLDYRPTFWNSVEDSQKAAQEAIDLASVVLGNKIECQQALGINNPDDVIKALFDRGVKLAIVKMGGDGVVLASEDEKIVLKPHQIKLISGAGSGDAFGGALMHGLISHWPLEKIGQYANASGAIVASRLLCSDAMPTMGEIDQFLATGRI